MRTSRPAWTFTALLGLALFALSDLLFFDMAFLRRAKDLLRGQGSPRTGEQDAQLGGGHESDRSVYWKADFGQDVEVTRNFYHELGDHGYVAVLYNTRKPSFQTTLLRRYLYHASDGATTKPKTMSLHP